VPPTAKSLILDLLSTLREGSMPVRALVAAGALFGLDENNVRVALARLLAAGLVARDERGRYRVGTGAEAVGRQVARWRRLEEVVRPWDGTWVVVHGAGRRGAGALRFHAFRALAPGLHLRPDNLAGGVLALRDELGALGLPGTALVATLRDLAPTVEARARRLWDTRRLVAAYRASRIALGASERRLPRLPPARAMIESFLLGGRVIRQIVLDPLLPEVMMPVAERAALVAAMRRYDRVGRASWAGFLREFDVLPAARAPVDLRLVEGVGRRARVA
jgi:phenylacetic acid degradation operon negative regulatory protein